MTDELDGVTTPIADGKLQRKLSRRVVLLMCFASLPLASCGQTGDSGTTNVQGGAARAPGAPPAAKP